MPPTKPRVSPQRLPIVDEFIHLSCAMASLALAARCRRLARRHLDEAVLLALGSDGRGELVFG